MKIKIGCAIAVLAVLCCEATQGGALKKSFVKNNGQKQENVEKHVADGEETSTPESNSSQESATTDGAGKVTEPAAVPVEEKKTESKKIVGDPVVARVNGKKEFRRGQILIDMKNIPNQLMNGVSPDQLFVMLRDQKVVMYLMLEQAKKMGLDKDKVFLMRMKRIEEDILIRMFLEKEIGPKVKSEATLKARYAKYLAEFKKDKAYHLRHIAVKTEDEAKGVLAALAKGEDFAKLAKEKSFIASKDKDGDEGDIPSRVMPDAIKDKITCLQVGDYTKEAIKTDNGFHIFKVDGIKDTTPLSLEESRPVLEQLIAGEEVAKAEQRLLKQAKVEKFNEDGSPEKLPVTAAKVAAAK